jgi:hypothetical protein
LHQGSTGLKLQRRDKDHVAAWKKEQARSNGLARRKIELLEGQLEQMRVELEQRPVHVIHENLDAETVAKAESDRNAAYRSRDKTMQSLCIIRLLHQERTPGECSCGQRYSKCKTALAVNELEFAKGL